MVNYNIVKYCGMCRKRFVQNNSHLQKAFCDQCQVKRDKYVKEQGG